MPTAKPCLGYPSRTAAAVALHAAGKSNIEIAEAIGVTVSTAGALSVGRSRPGRRRKLTEQQVVEVCEMRERGLSFGRIANHLAARGIDIHPNSISWICLVNGADLPAHRRSHNRTVVPGSTCQRGNHVVRRFSEAEDEQLREMDAGGVPYSEMAKRLGRKRNSIMGRLATLARRDTRQEEGGE